GEAELINLVIGPDADDVTLALNGRAGGVEDTDIPLIVNPTSSDPSETFNVTIANIPTGATITYDGTALTPTAGEVTISDFDRSKSLTIQPPADSNEDFTLQVSADSVDALGSNTDTQQGPILDVNVDVTGVADAATITTPPTTPEYGEADLDDGSATVALSDL